MLYFPPGSHFDLSSAQACRIAPYYGNSVDGGLLQAAEPAAVCVPVGAHLLLASSGEGATLTEGEAHDFPFGATTVVKC